MAVTELRRNFNTISNHLVRGMIIKLSLAMSSNHLQNLALPQPHQPPCPLSVLSDWVTVDSPLCIVYIIPQYCTLLAYGNSNGPLLLPSLDITLVECSPSCCLMDVIVQGTSSCYSSNLNYKVDGFIFLFAHRTNFQLSKLSNPV